MARIKVVQDNLKRPVPPHAEAIKQGKRRNVYLFGITAALLLALLNSPFNLFQSVLPASWTAPFLVSPDRCRCLYGESCWPSSSEFAELAKHVSQPLLHPKPTAAPCYLSSSPSEECAAVMEGFADGIWRAEQPGSMQNSNFETFVFPNGTIDACYLNATLGLSCNQGSIAVIGVDARTPEDVQAAVKFAKKHNLRLTIKNTGHDYLGRSAARGSFLIWTHHMKEITYHATLTPAGSPTAEEKVITLGAGVQWHEAYDAVHTQGRVIVGGISPGGSNGAAGGWILGGGHSILSPKHGLGIDNVVRFTIVTANGDYLTVSEHQYPDLFWALRGGGAGTYGVLVSVTYRTHPSTPLIGGYFSASINSPTVGPTPVLKKLITELLRIMPALSDAGWAGYPTIEPDPATGHPTLAFLMIAPNVSWADANVTINPFFEYARSLEATSTFDDGGALTIKGGFTMPLDSFHSWETAWFRKIGLVGSNVILGSRLIPRDVVETNYVELAEVISAFPGGGFYLVAGGAVSEKDPESAGLNPAWRKALLHTVFWGVWNEGAPYEYIKQVEAWVGMGVSKLHAIAPDSGAYSNEAFMHEQNPQATFFGSHYDKLLAIQKKYDPTGLFVVATGVGHEMWDNTLNCHV